MMNPLFLADAGGLAIFAALGVVGVLAAICISLLYLLFPIIVMIQLSGLKSAIKEKSAEHEAISSATLEEIRVQNALTRQLLRAYGHEPEV